MNRSPGIFVLKPLTVLHVRRLKLYRRRRKGHHGRVQRIQLLKNNQNNNIVVVTTAFHDGLLKQCKWYQNVVFSMTSIRSIKRKDKILMEVIKDENLCVLFVTETWLKMENYNDNLQKKATCI